SHHNILNNGFFTGERVRYTPNDRICLPVPFYHCFGCVLGSLAALTHGSAIVLPSESFDAEASLRAVQDERCTSLYGVPTMFIAELEHPAFSSYHLDNLRTGIMAGAPCPVEVMRQVIDRMHMRDVTICYGMTETAPVSFQSCPDDPIATRVSTVGAVHPHVECKIIYPREIEEFLHTHPKISEAQVIGVPDKKYGEEVCAWVRLREGQKATADEIRDYCQGRIATYKIPRYIRFTTEFPMTVTGKI